MSNRSFFISGASESQINVMIIN